MWSLSCYCLTDGNAHSVHMAKVTGNFSLQSTPWENAKVTCSEIATLQNRQIKMQLKYSVLQYFTQSNMYMLYGEQKAVYNKVYDLVDWSWEFNTQSTCMSFQRGSLHSQSLDWYRQTKQYRKIHKLNTSRKKQTMQKSVKTCKLITRQNKLHGKHNKITANKPEYVTHSLLTVYFLTQFLPTGIYKRALIIFFPFFKMYVKLYTKSQNL